ANVPKIGADEITGDATRTRRSAPPIASAIRWASFSPRFGANHVRTGESPTRIGSVATRPDASTFRFFHSCAKSSWKRMATLVDLVHVVNEPHVDATLVRADQRGLDDISRLGVQPDVVERKLQRLARAVYERRDPPRDLQRRLPAIGEGVNLDQGCCFAGRR